ncbi:hypothetical protein PaeBR_07235 [Paenibacillus sp. BR2-3]|uniref:hypothetical protein n=1 Tax=Paenibacillus sp. BR2-3 TaxID=3048494 RepID=UPI0039775116
MAIQFLDLRLSNQNPTDAPPLPVPPTATPALIGDIGIQTAGVLPGNEGDVRVLLAGHVTINTGVVEAAETITFTVLRNGVPIFTTDFIVQINALTDSELADITATDTPPAADVLAGEINYTLTVSSTAAVSLATLGARNFSGVAAAGTTTS